VIALDRDQAVSIGVLAALLVVCAAMVGLSLKIRSDAAQDLDEQRRSLSRLDARARARSDARVRSGAAASVAAFLDAPTQGLAVAQLQARLALMADIHHCVLMSSGMEPAGRDDGPDQIRLQATLEASSQALQALLYALESGTPYVFVDALAVQLTGGASQRAAQDPLLHVTLGLRAAWQRGAG
jgi:general secretion pathway protein M